MRARLCCIYFYKITYCTIGNVFVQLGMFLYKLGMFLYKLECHISHKSCNFAPENNKNI